MKPKEFDDRVQSNNSSLKNNIKITNPLKFSKEYAADNDVF